MSSRASVCSPHTGHGLSVRETPHLRQYSTIHAMWPMIDRRHDQARAEQLTAGKQ